ncbi:MAG: lipid-binding SYLF domain-containing protein [Pirellulaceae bacterium]
MKTPYHFAGRVALGLSLCCVTAIEAQGFQLPAVEVQSREAGIVESASQVLNEIMAVPNQGIPRSLLADAQGIAIVPDLLKGGFIVGVRHGRGVIVVRDDNGTWKSPTFIKITGGSLGWQVGVQATDLVLVFKTKTSVESLMKCKLTIGGGVAAAAGPVGRQAEVGTDVRLKAEIFSYSRSRGLFAGLALDGSVIQVDTRSNAAYYGFPATGQPQNLPPSALRLLAEVTKYTSAEGGEINVTALPVSYAAGDVQTVRRELADSSRQLSVFLDEGWRKHLALPAEVFGTDRLPPVDQLSRSLSKFDQVATDPQYQVLAKKPEFQQTRALLKKLCALQTPSSPLSLPPPPPDRN